MVIYLNRAMPLEGGLYQWAKLGFGELTGFLVAWNLWLFAILNTSETGIQVTQYFRYVLGPQGEWLTGDRRFVVLVSTAIFSALVILTIRGLRVGKWVHTAGGALMLMTFAMLIALPWLNVAHGTLPAFHPLAMSMPVMSIFSLNIAAKMGFGALGGFEYVAIHAGECRNPERTIARSVALAAPIIAVMFILGTSSVLALVPIERIDLIAPIPQVLAEGFTPFGSAGAVATLTILALLCIRIAQASVLFAGNTRLPMVAGWDGLLPQWFTRMHPRFQTPVNSIIFVGAITLAFSIVRLDWRRQAGGVSAVVECGRNLLRDDLSRDVRHPDRRLARARLAEDRGALRLCVNVAVRSDLDSFPSFRSRAGFSSRQRSAASFSSRTRLASRYSRARQGFDQVPQGSTRFYGVRGSTGSWFHGDSRRQGSHWRLEAQTSVGAQTRGTAAD